MKREEIRAIFADATDEQIKSVMDLNGADLEKAKSKVAALEAELKETKEDKAKINTEFEKLKAENASGEAWKVKFEALQAENEAKEKQAEADRILAEKTESLKKRFASANEGKGDWYNTPTEEHYFKLFGEALESEEYAGKSDIDILHALTKDDQTARKGITAVKLQGGTPQGVGGKQYASKAEIMAIKNYDEKIEAISNNKHLFVKGDK